MTSPEVQAAAAAAAQLLDLPPEPSRSRTVARLLRHALEQAVDAFWDQLRPGEITTRSTRARRIRLVAAYNQDVARDTYATWCLLSDASRPRLYATAPAVHELQTLCDRTTRVLASLVALQARVARDTGTGKDT